ncbi:unnamed protein product, partial [Rotaria magnacalcarata]
MSTSISSTMPEISSSSTIEVTSSTMGSSTTFGSTMGSVTNQELPTWSSANSDSSVASTSTLVATSIVNSVIETTTTSETTSHSSINTSETIMASTAAAFSASFEQTSSSTDRLSLLSEAISSIGTTTQGLNSVDSSTSIGYTSETSSVATISPAVSETIEPTTNTPSIAD